MSFSMDWRSFVVLLTAPFGLPAGFPLWPALKSAEDAGTARNGDYLPMQKLEKMRPSRSSLQKSPVISPKMRWAW